MISIKKIDINFFIVNYCIIIVLLYISNMSFIEEMRELSIKSKQNPEVKKVNPETQKINEIVYKKLEFLTNKYYDTILEEIKKAASYGNEKCYVNFEEDDFTISDLNYDIFKLKKRWLSTLMNKDSELVPKGKPSIHGFHFHVLNKKVNNKSSVILYWTTKVI